MRKKEQKLVKLCLKEARGQRVKENPVKQTKKEKDLLVKAKSS